MAEVNIHGLSRTIPDEIKRKVRQECGFGCVCCGLAIATYEHIDPSFKDATEHDPSKMAYLGRGGDAGNICNLLIDSASSGRLKADG